ncbi:MAG: hypothetical protein AB1589_14370 [Cyanobacteriota bacterium]
MFSLNSLNKAGTCPDNPTILAQQCSLAVVDPLSLLPKSSREGGKGEENREGKEDGEGEEGGEDRE